MRRHLLVPCVVTTAVLALVGCRSDEPATPASQASTSADTAPVRLDEATREATVTSGDTIEIVIGEVNSSIGDQWELRNVRPEGAVTVLDERYDDRPCEDATPGCGDGTLIWVLRVEGAGVVTFDADNCYRGVCPGEPGSEPETLRRTYAVTVTTRG